MEIRINLIPPYRKEEISKAKRFNLVIRLGLAVFSIFILFFSFLFGLYKTLEINSWVVSNYQEPVSGYSKYDQIKKFDDEFEKINSRISQIAMVKNDQLYWSNLFINLSESASSGIEITDLTTNNYKVSLAGGADNRDSLIAFKDRLTEEDCFSDINLPLSNLVSKENIVFQMDFKIKEECLKRR